MLNLALNFAVSTIVLVLSFLFIPYLEMENILTIVPTCFILGFMNFLIRPMMVMLGIDLNELKIGVFSFFLNWFFFNVGAGLLDEFDEQSWIAAFFGALVMGLFQVILYRIDWNRGKTLT